MRIMKINWKFVVALAALVLTTEALLAAVPKVIFDTDMYTDFDDVGAMALLHALADAGECEILGTVVSTRNTPSSGMVELVNRFYGRGDLPIGSPRDVGLAPDVDPGSVRSASYRIFANMVGASTSLRFPTSDLAPDANDVYRRLLAAAPDAGVTVVTVGFTTNLRRLLETKGDRHSPLDGRQLVARKVKAWYAMACHFPNGYEYNSGADAESSKLVFAEWPTPVYFLDFRYGYKVKCGVPVSKMPDEVMNPVRDVFRQALEAHNETKVGHAAWDQIAVLAAVRGWEKYFGVTRGRFEIVDAKGNNRWTEDPNGRHYVLTEKTPRHAVGKIIDELMARPPKNGEKPSPVKIVAGRDWIPMAPMGDILPGSALDFSMLRGTEAPAGKYGRVVAKGSTFEFEKRPGVSQRFYGVNLCMGANVPPTYEDARRFAARLRKMGYNAVRFHHHECELLQRTNNPAATKLDVERMRRFDGLVAACVENGIYMTTDLHVSRGPISWRSIGVDRDGTVQGGKVWMLVHAGMQSNLCEFVRNWFNHVNEYTGRRLADEPALACVSLVNEGAIGNNGHYVDYLATLEPWVDAWRKWLAAKKAREPEFYGKLDESFPETLNGFRDRKKQAFILFLQETESAFMKKMRAFMRDELKCGVPLTSMNGLYHPIAYQYCKEADYDYVDDHFYVDHPRFLEKSWRLPSYCPNANPLVGRHLGVTGAAFRRVLNRPFTVSEFNYSGPGRFRGMGGIATGALAALQGWNGIWRFAWSHGVGGVVEPERKWLNYFDVSGDPLSLASERASVCLFLRRDLPELKKTYAVHLPNDMMRKPHVQSIGWTYTTFIWAAWYAKVGTQLGETAPRGAISAGTYPEVIQATREKVFADLGLGNAENGDFPTAGDGAVHVDGVNGDFFVSTPNTCGGFSERGPIRSTALTVELEGAAATVWASSLDGKPLASSARILLTHLTDVQNTNIAYRDERLKVLTGWGHLPHLMRNGTARCRLRVADGRWTVHALGADGRRLRAVPSRAAQGALDFTAKVDADPSCATYLYELVRDCN